MFDFDKKVAKIEGWMTKEEGEFLYHIARKLPHNGKIIEIGSWKGRSTICLGLGSKTGNGATIYAIDPHIGSSEHHRWFGKVDTYKEFVRNIQTSEIDNYVVILKETSQSAAQKIEQPVHFVLVDGAHEYKLVKLDYDLWFPKLMEHGLIVFHDCWHAPGVHFLTAQILLTSKRVKNPRLLDTFTIMEKVEVNTLSDRVYNMFFVFYRLLFGWIGTLKLDYFGTVKKSAN